MMIRLAVVAYNFNMNRTLSICEDSSAHFIFEVPILRDVEQAQE